jgi:hypothetical protein
MNLLVKRRWFTQRSTVGELWVNGDKQYFTLEPPYGLRTGRTRPNGLTAPAAKATSVRPAASAIPFGTYPLTIRYSLKHQRNVPHVEKVPGFSEIEIHAGNFPKDTEGCVLVGITRAEDYVGRSTEAFEQLFAKLSARAQGEEMTIAFEEER